MQQNSQITKLAQNGRPGWQVALAGMTGLAIAVGIGRFAFTPILPMMQDDAGLSVAQGGWLASANYLGYFVGAVWALVHRVRSSYATRSALVMIALSTMAMAWAEGLHWWLVLRAVAGIASAWGLIHITSWCVEQLAPLDKPLLGGAVFAGVGVGIGLAGALCFALMAAGANSQQAWLMLGGASLVATAITWPILGHRNAIEPATKPAHGRFRWTRDSIRLVLCYGACGVGYIIPATFLPAMAKQVIQDPFVFGWAWPVFGLTAACSTLLAAPLARALGNRRMWRLGALAMALGVVSPLMVPGISGIIFAATLVGGTFMVTTMVGIQEARAIAQQFASSLVAAFTAAFAAGQVLGPVLVSSLILRFDSMAPALLIAAGILMASVLALGNSEQTKAYSTMQ